MTNPITEEFIQITVRGYDTARRQLTVLTKAAKELAKPVATPIKPAIAVARPVLPLARPAVDRSFPPIPVARALPVAQRLPTNAPAPPAGVPVARALPVAQRLPNLPVAQRLPNPLARPVLPVARALPVGKPLIDPAQVKVVGGLTAALGKIGDGLDKIGSKARTAFAVGTAGVLGFARAASPGDWLKFESAMARVSVQIGALFLPVIRQFTQWLNRLADALNKLTPAQREQIGQWTKLGLVALGVVGVVTKLVGVIPGLVGGFSSLAGVVRSVAVALGATGAVALGPIALIAAAVAGVVALGAVAVSVAGKTDQVRAGFFKVWEAVQKVGQAWWDAAKPVLAVFGEIVARYVALATRVYTTVLGVVAKVYGVVGQVTAKIAGAVGGVADQVMGLIEDVMDAVQPLINLFGDQFIGTLELVAKSISTVFTTLLDGIKTAVNELRVLGEVARQAAENPVAVMKDLDLAFKAARNTVRVHDDERKQKRDNAGKGEGGKAGQEGPILAYQPELMGISDAFRKAQTAALGESPDVARFREQKNLMEQHNQHLIDIKNGVNKQGLR